MKNRFQNALDNDLTLDLAELGHLLSDTVSDFIEDTGGRVGIYNDPAIKLIGQHIFSLLEEGDFDSSQQLEVYKRVKRECEDESWKHQEREKSRKIAELIFENRFEHRDSEGNLQQMVWVYVLFRADGPDGVERDNLRRIPATLEAYQEFYKDVEKGAEESFSVNIVSRNEAEKYVPHYRDRMTEAFEDGHPYCI